MEYNHERRKLRIATWIVVALLILSIIGASLLFALSNRTKNKTKQPNVVNVGDSISKNGTNNVTIPNASVWVGGNATNWSGSGTEADPYLISSGSHLAGLSASVNSGTTYAGKYFKLTTNLDMGGEGYIPQSTGTVTLNYENYSHYSVGDTFTEGDYTYTVISKTEPSSGSGSTSDILYITSVAGDYDAGEVLQSGGSESVTVTTYYYADMEMAGYSGWRLGTSDTIEGEYISITGYRDMVHESDFQSSGLNESDFDMYICDPQMYVYEVEVILDGGSSSYGGVYCSYTYGKGKAFTPIGIVPQSTSTSFGQTGGAYFAGNFDGDGHTIGNLAILSSVAGKGLFGYIKPDGYNVNIKNLNIIFDYTQTITSATSSGGTFVNKPVGDYFGGLCGRINLTDNYKTYVSNVNVSYNKSLVFNQTAKINMNIGGLIGSVASGEITNCTVTGFKVTITSSISTAGGILFGGVVGGFASNKLSGVDNIISKCSSDAYLSIQTSYAKYIGGITGWMTTGNVEDCYFNGSLIHNSHQTNTSQVYQIGGIVGRAQTPTTIQNNLFQGTLQYYTRTKYDSGYQEIAGGILGMSNATTVVVKNNISNGTFKDYNTSTAYDRSGGIVGGQYSPTGVANNVYNTSKTTLRSNSYSPSFARTGATTDANVKQPSTYADWTDFDSHWIINKKINNGYPMLSAFVPVTPVTGFDGNGTADSPYLISNQQELIGFANYYNNNSLTELNKYWKLTADIDVSKNASNVLIHFAPVCYNGTFDGYFDGNSKTISGLLIDKQYQYTGLFGTIASGSYVKNLTVNGTIYWDQTYAVGGVAGRVMAGGYLQNCVFNGNIIGVLNTKSSTECHGVVGKYEIGGANNCSATYIELKYAKIGGTTTAPTYTYYLYDWSQITTRLYNSLV